MTLISVILPVFNGEQYIQAAVESILRQTWTTFELIVIDDGSTDGTLNQLKTIQAKDPRIVLVSRENRGLIATLNEGIDRASGDWIARMDADDVALPTRFEKQMRLLEKTGADICGTWVQYTGTADRRVLAHPGSPNAVNVALLFGSPLAHPSVIMRREIASRLRYEPGWEACEDYDLWERAARSGAKIVNVQEVLLEYRLHANQVSARNATRQLELTQQIRRRCWSHFMSSLKIDNPQWIDEILKLREARPPVVNIAMIEKCFEVLLRTVEGETRQTMFHHMTNLFKRAGASGLSVPRAWSRLNRQFGANSGLLCALQMAFLGLFHLGPADAAYGWLKQITFRIPNKE